MPMSLEFKGYYLFVLAFWIHSVSILLSEPRRNDHYAMLSHHIITILLVALSWYGNFHRIGHAIMLIMDIGDIPLSVTKMLRYAGEVRVSNVLFVLFMLLWIVTRFYLYFYVLYSCLFELPTFPEVMGWHPEEGRFLSQPVYYIFAVLLIALAGLMVFWGWLIARVAYKATAGTGVDDVRSDSEESDKEE